MQNPTPLLVFRCFNKTSWLFFRCFNKTSWLKFDWLIDSSSWNWILHAIVCGKHLHMAVRWPPTQVLDNAPGNFCRLSETEARNPSFLCFCNKLWMYGWTRILDNCGSEPREVTVWSFDRCFGTPCTSAQCTAAHFRSRHHNLFATRQDLLTATFLDLWMLISDIRYWWGTTCKNN